METLSQEVFTKEEQGFLATFSERLKGITTLNTDPSQPANAQQAEIATRDMAAGEAPEQAPADTERAKRDLTAMGEAALAGAAAVPPGYFDSAQYIDDVFMQVGGGGAANGAVLPPAPVARV